MSVWALLAGLEGANVRHITLQNGGNRRPRGQGAGDPAGPGRLKLPQGVPWRSGGYRSGDYARRALPLTQYCR